MPDDMTVGGKPAGGTPLNDGTPYDLDPRVGGCTPGTPGADNTVTTDDSGVTTTVAGPDGSGTTVLAVTQPNGLSDITTTYAPAADGSVTAVTELRVALDVPRAGVRTVKTTPNPDGSKTVVTTESLVGQPETITTERAGP